MDPASHKRQKLSNEHASLLSTQSQSDIFLHNKQGSVIKDPKAINAKRCELIGIIERLQEVLIQQPYRSPLLKSSDATLYSFGQIGNNYSSDNVIKLDADKNNTVYYTQANVGNTGADLTVSAVDSNDKDMVKSLGDEYSSSNPNYNYTQQHVLLELPVGHQEIIKLDNCNSSTDSQVLVKKVKDNMDTDNFSAETKKIIPFDSHCTSEQQMLVKEVCGNIITNIENDLKKKRKFGTASYEVSSEVIQNEPRCNSGNHQDKESLVDELDDLWIGMSVALACSEIDHQSIVPLESNCEETEDACNHNYLLKDDLGIVCRICGLIQQRIESIFEHSWKKRNRHHTHPAHDGATTVTSSQAVEYSLTILSVVPDTMSIHPHHSQQMKPHQNPGGCILAHAPGSGKTFLLISFVHSFLARYPAGRPLIMLPKGILGIWKSEFLRWQVENIPLYELYSSKIKSKSEQHKVLKLWKENRSILLLGYQQFEHIINDDSSDRATIIALETIQTPRKVVLSGTLFQNHVSEVFNILNLVRPRFLKIQRCRAIMKRILTKVDMSGKCVRSKTISEKVFYELVEENLQNDSKTMRMMIIQNLRELTENVLHYYQGEILKELPGLVDFIVLLNMSRKQEDLIKSLKGLNRFELRAKCNAVSLHPYLKDKDVENVDKKSRSISKRKMNSNVHIIDISEGVKAKFIYNLLSLSEAAGEKVIVFSQYVRSLDFLETLFTKMKGWKPEVNTFQMDGSLTQEQREQAAWAFRPGQSKVVYCYRLVASGSLEEEDHHTAFKKELVSKLWFEWDEHHNNEDFELAKVDVSDSKDRFLDSPALQEDIKSLFKR
ncbi:hypothetical protein BS78_01G470100 [Paspalum vaginatum]|nr:hypothetical protein BS78_01G470100 [Paspalum vaginatum]